MTHTQQIHAAYETENMSSDTVAAFNRVLNRYVKAKGLFVAGLISLDEALDIVRNIKR